MNIPFLSSVISARKESNALRKEELEISKQQIELNRKNIELKNEAMKSIMAMTTIDRTLSDELYGNSGANYKIGAWNLPIDKMRQMSRIVYWDSGFARSIIDRFVQIIVGKGLTLESRPAWRMIKGFSSQELKKEKIEEIQTRWDIFSSSKNVHYLKEFNLNKLINLAMFYFFYDGEFHMIFRYAGTGVGRNPMTIDFVAPENVKMSTSEKDVPKGNKVVDGIEYSGGIAVAVHVLNPASGNSTRIPKYGQRSGRQLWYHNYNKKNERQRRGVPLLAGEISELTQLADYQNLELQAAKINALFAMWIEPPEGSDGRETISSGARKKSVQGVDPQTGETYTSKIEEMGFSTGGIIVDKLPAGHKVQSFDTKRPNINFEPFTSGIKRNIASSAGEALSLVDYNYSQQYSSARGENIVQWMKVDEIREHVPADCLSVIFYNWLWYEVEAGKIDLPGFIADEEIRDAWCKANWKGSPLPDIDPEKSMKANKMEVDEGIRTRQSVSVSRGGGDFADNVMILESENNALAQSRKNILEVEKTTYSISKTESKSESVSRSENG